MLPNNIKFITLTFFCVFNIDIHWSRLGANVTIEEKLNNEHYSNNIYKFGPVYKSKDIIENNIQISKFIYKIGCPGFCVLYHQIKDQFVAYSFQWNHTGQLDI